MRGWAIASLLTACYAPSPPLGAPCGEPDACPAGQFCVQGRCSSSGSAGLDDATTTLDGDHDAFIAPPQDAAVDTPAVPPVMRFGNRTGATANTVADVFLDGSNNVGVHPDLHITSNPVARSCFASTCRRFRATRPSRAPGSRSSSRSKRSRWGRTSTCSS